MIVDDASSDSEIEEYLASHLSTSNQPSVDPGSQRAVRFTRWSPVEISDNEEGGGSDVLKIPNPGAGPRRTSEAVAQWQKHNFRWDSVDSLSEDEVNYEDTPLQMKQLYLLVARCIAYPFNARFQMETTPPKPKLNEESYFKICGVLQSCVDQERSLLQELILSGNEQKCIKSSEFCTTVEWYLNNILLRDDVKVACFRGGFSTKEIEHTFRVAIARQFRDIFTVNEIVPGERLTKRIEGDPKFQVWVSTFVKLVELGRQMTMSEKEKKKLTKQSGTADKDELYSMFQMILGISRSEHQALFRACHLNNPEEQEDVVRRELNKRRDLVKKGECCGLLVGQSRIVRARFLDELQRNLIILTDNLERQNLIAAEFGVSSKKKKPAPTSDSGSFDTLSKSEISFHHKVKVTIRDVTQIIGVPEGKSVFIVFELVDGNTPLVTRNVEMTKKHIAVFDESGEFSTNSPLPQLKFTLRMVTQGVFKDDKIIAKKIHTVMPTSTEINDVIDLQRNDGTNCAKLRITSFLERPSNIRKCGYLYCSGDSTFKQWKSRFLALMQLPQSNFVLCSYQPKDTHPKEVIILEGCTVDYLAEKQEDNEEAKYLFILNLSSEKGQIRFGCVTSSEREQWLQWFTRATGQTDKPAELKKDTFSGGPGGEFALMGLTDVINMDAIQQDHPKLFTKLFKAILNYRLNELDFSRGLFSPGQMYVIDEYCARYCIRLSHRHLTCLWEWLQCELKGQSIWPVMLLHSFGFCQMHVMEQRPQEHCEVVTPEEFQQWSQLSGQIELLLADKLENFRTHFPFSCPKDDLKVTMKLFILVAEINHCQGATQTMPLITEDRPMQLLISVMERAALSNYKQVYSKLCQCDEFESEISDTLSEDQLYVLAQLCVDFMYELHEFYAEDFTLYPLALSAHIDAFWSFFVVDLQECLRTCDACIVSLLKMFYSLNEYFCSQPTLKLSKFHQSLLTEFEPLVEKYLDDLDSGIKKDMQGFFERETWMPVTECCFSMQGCLEALESIKTFVEQLHWPQEPFATHLVTKVQIICSEKFEEAVNFTHQQCELQLNDFAVTFSTLLPKPVVTMVNTIMFLSVQAAPFCGLSSTGQVPPEQLTIAVNLTTFLETAIGQILNLVINKLCQPLHIILSQLSKYDPSYGFLSALKKLLPAPISIDQYCEYLQNNLQHLSRTLVSAAFTNFVLNWYETQMTILNDWLKKKPDFSVHETQLSSFETLIEEIRHQFLEEEIEEEQLNTDNFAELEDRMRKEQSQAAFLKGLND